MTGAAAPAWVQLSASQVETYSQCPRKWAWDKIAQVPRTSSPAAELGQEVHAQIEAYYKGVPLDLVTESRHVHGIIPGEVAMAGLHHLPVPGTLGLETEKEFHLTWTEEKIYWLGYKDLQYPTDAPTGSVSFPVTLEVADHKTTKNFGWAKTPETLKINIQAVIYAVDAMIASGVPYVPLRWVYYKTTKPHKSLPVLSSLTAEEAAPVFERIKSLSREMAYHRRNNTHPLQLTPNPAECQAYGGCAYISHCNLTPNEMMRGYMSQSNFNAGAPPGIPPAFNPPPPAQAAAAPPPAGVDPGAAKFFADLGLSPDGKTPLGAAPPPAPAAPPPASAAPAWAQPPAPAAAPPPVAAPPPAAPPPPAAAPPAPPLHMSPDGTQYWNGAGWVPVPTATGPLPAAPPAAPVAAAPPAYTPPPPPAPPKAGPGRPAKDAAQKAAMAAAYRQIADGFTKLAAACEGVTEV